MDDHRNAVAEALEKYVSHSRVPWSFIVIGLSLIYFLAEFIPWAVRGFPVTR